MDNVTKGEDSEVKREEPSNFDAKITSDTKSVQARIVRGTKKMRIDSTELAQVSEKDQKKESKDEESAEAKIVRSLKRSCELWSTEDKNTFFKAINEFGKDFDALQSYFLSQGKKRGLPENMIKNKEQIRHFYYRTWLKISKHLKFSEDVKKATQEIYGLINYGELRRKLPRIHEKVLLKLNELIYWGSTQVRLRGKTMRIKTPICRALRKLNQLEDWQEEIKLPSRVTIELRPGNNMTWWQVQAHAMNPRVRTLLPIQRRLSSLLMFLQQRWRPAKYTTCTNNAESLEQIDSKDRRLLRVSPPDGCKIALPVVNLGEYLTSNSVSFNSYEKRLSLKSSRLELLGSVQYIKGVGKKAIKKYKIDKKLPNRGSEDPQLLQQQFVPSDSGNIDLDSPERNLNVGADKNVVTGGHSNFDVAQQETETWNEPNRFPGRETIERIRLGWTIDEANTITVGDLFLMFGRESKVSLEYWWDTGELDNEASISSVDRSKSTRNCGPGQSHEGGTLCLALQKLLSIAKHNYGTSKIYDNTSGSNETVVSSRVPSAKESTFRRPLIPQVYHKIGTQDAFKTQLDKFKSRFCKRGRTVRQRSLIVQRVLPAIPSYDSSPNNISDTNEQQKDVIPMNNEIPSMPDQRPDDKNIQSVGTISDGKEFMTGTLQSENAGSTKPSNSIITSATQILKEGEHQWLNSEVADFSLSSFLGQLESPIKGSQRSQTGGHPVVEDARPSSDVVSHMQCLMGESSVDYMAKFANLASQIASDEQKKSTSS